MKINLPETMKGIKKHSRYRKGQKMIQVKLD